jgi:hypothetical protein
VLGQPEGDSANHCVGDIEGIDPSIVVGDGVGKQVGFSVHIMGMILGFLEGTSGTTPDAEEDRLDGTSVGCSNTYEGEAVGLAGGGSDWTVLGSAVGSEVGCGVNDPGT